MAPWYRERHPDDHSLKLKTEWLKNDIFRMNAANNWDNVNKIDWLTRCRFTLYLEWFHWKIYIFWYSHNPNAVRVPEIFRCISTLAILICLNLPPVNTKPSVILTQWPPDTTVSVSTAWTISSRMLNQTKLATTFPREEQTSVTHAGQVGVRTRVCLALTNLLHQQQNLAMANKATGQMKSFDHGWII